MNATDLEYYIHAARTAVRAYPGGCKLPVPAAHLLALCEEVKAARQKRTRHTKEKPR